VACWLLPQLPCVELNHFVVLTFDVLIGIINSIVSRSATYLRAQTKHEIAPLRASSLLRNQAHYHRRGRHPGLARRRGH
jgi:hypothetical protein